MPSVKSMSTTYTSVGAEQPERIGLVRQLGVDTGYVLLGFPLAVLSFSVLVAGFSAGLGALVVVLGVPILAGTLIVARFFADIERLRIPAVLRRPLIRPTYRAPEPGAGFWKKIVTPLAQSQFWLDLTYGIVHFPIAVVTFSIVVSWWATAIGGTLSIAWDWSIPRSPDNTSLAQLIGLGDSAFARIGFQTATGLVCLVSLPFVVRGCALLSAGFSRLLLTGVAEMRQTITVLT
ncbi:histidine kinase, partial [Mycobacterium sp. ITM-2017-0098]